MLLIFGCDAPLGYFFPAWQLRKQFASLTRKQMVYAEGVFLLRPFFSGSFRFTIKLRESYKDFPYTLCSLLLPRLPSLPHTYLPHHSLEFHQGDLR